MFYSLSPYRSSSAIDHQIKKFFMLYEDPYKIIDSQKISTLVGLPPHVINDVEF